MPQLRHSGRACRCPTCEAYFLGVSAFDSHRDGPWVDRRCFTASQMLERGWKVNPDGYWVPPEKKLVA